MDQTEGKLTFGVSNIGHPTSFRNTLIVHGTLGLVVAVASYVISHATSKIVTDNVNFVLEDYDIIPKTPSK